MSYQDYPRHQDFIGSSNVLRNYRIFAKRRGENTHFHAVYRQGIKFTRSEGIAHAKALNIATTYIHHLPGISNKRLIAL